MVEDASMEYMSRGAHDTKDIPELVDGSPEGLGRYNTTQLFQPLETNIKTHLISALTGRSTPNDLPVHVEYNLTLPPGLGGTGVRDPTTISSHEYNTS